MAKRTGAKQKGANPGSKSDREAVALANNPVFLALIEESRRSYAEQGGMNLNEVCRDFGLKTTPAVRRRKKKS
jgi:hypothetical protein